LVGRLSAVRRTDNRPTSNQQLYGSAPRIDVANLTATLRRILRLYADRGDEVVAGCWSVSCRCSALLITDQPATKN
jgi:hypothetical protein